jgi:hypothetical protein
LNRIEVQGLPFARQSDLEAEASARSSADSTLGAAIGNETIARSAADTGIRNAVDLYNVTQKIPLQSGYYTPAAARAAVPADIRKKGLIITYRVSETEWRTEQFFQGETAAWTTGANWKETGTDYSEDVTAINNDIGVLKKTSFIHLASDINLDTVLSVGVYYIGTEEVPDGIVIPTIPAKDFLFVAGTKNLLVGTSVNDVTQYRINKDGLSMRRHHTADVVINGETKPAYWDEWKDIAGVDPVEMEYAIATLARTSFRNLPPDAGTDAAIAPGAYYVGEEETPESDGEYGKNYLFTVGDRVLKVGDSPVRDVTQYMMTNDGISMRVHYSGYDNGHMLISPRWGDWTGLVTGEFISSNIKTVDGATVSYLGKDNVPFLTDDGEKVGIAPGRKFGIPAVALSGAASRYCALDSGGYVAALTKDQMKERLSINELANDCAGLGAAIAAEASARGEAVEILQRNIDAAVTDLGTVSLAGLDEVTREGVYKYSVVYGPPFGGTSTHVTESGLLSVARKSGNAIGRQVTQFRIHGDVSIRRGQAGNNEDDPFVWSEWKTLHSGETTVAVNIGPLPNAGSKAVAHGIDGILSGEIRSISGYARNESDIVALPHASRSSAGECIQVVLDAENVIVSCGTDRSDFTEAKIHITYR